MPSLPSVVTAIGFIVAGAWLTKQVERVLDARRKIADLRDDVPDTLHPVFSRRQIRLQWADWKRAAGEHQEALEDFRALSSDARRSPAAVDRAAEALRAHHKATYEESDERDLLDRMLLANARVFRGEMTRREALDFVWDPVTSAMTSMTSMTRLADTNQAVATFKANNSPTTGA